MNIFLKNKSKNKESNVYFFSFIFPILFVFPFLFSYSFLATKGSNYSKQNLERYNAVSLDEEIVGMESAIKALDLREIDNILLDASSTENVSNNSYTKSPVKILMFGYHQIREIKPTDGTKTRMFITTPEIFEKEMKFLSDNGYHTISTTDYINYLKTGSANFNLNKSIILTFDDGYASQYTNAFPILKKYSFTGTFFIYSDCVDKYPVCLTSVEIKDLAKNGMKIGNHTDHHAYLPKYSDETIKNEIAINKQKIIDMVGTSSVENVFAYPYGGVDNRIENIVKSFGYDGASGIFASKKSKDTDLFNLKRYLLGEDFNFFESLFK